MKKSKRKERNKCENYLMNFETFLSNFEYQMLIVNRQLAI